MMVTFVSQCEHKALNRTRRVLDAFANRISSVNKPLREQSEMYIPPVLLSTNFLVLCTSRTMLLLVQL